MLVNDFKQDNTLLNNLPIELTGGENQDGMYVTNDWLYYPYCTEDSCSIFVARNSGTAYSYHCTIQILIIKGSYGQGVRISRGCFPAANDKKGRFICKQLKEMGWY